jgi:hypothetical protein
MIYDQSGGWSQRHDGGDDQVYRIWSASAIITIGTSGKPFAFIDAEDRGSRSTSRR